MTNLIELTILRGVVEKFIDKLLSDKSLSTSRIIFDNMKPAIKNSDDAIFGYIYGTVLGKLDAIYANFNRQPTDEEIKEIVNAIQKRTIEIRSRIYETKT